MQYRRPIYIQFLRFFLNLRDAYNRIRHIYLQHVQRMKRNEAWIESPYIMHSNPEWNLLTPPIIKLSLSTLNDPTQMQYRRPIYIQLLRFFLNYVVLINRIRHIYLQRINLNEAWIVSQFIIVILRTLNKILQPRHHQVNHSDPKWPCTNQFHQSLGGFMINFTTKIGFVQYHFKINGNRVVF